MTIVHNKMPFLCIVLFLFTYLDLESVPELEDDVLLLMIGVGLAQKKELAQHLLSNGFSNIHETCTPQNVQNKFCNYCTDILHLSCPNLPSCSLLPISLI